MQILVNFLLIVSMFFSVLPLSLDARQTQGTVKDKAPKTKEVVSDFVKSENEIYASPRINNTLAFSGYEETTVESQARLQASLDHLETTTSSALLTSPIQINFNTYSPSSFGSEDVKPTMTIEDGGNTLHISGNSWKKIGLPYTITPYTVLEFDFKSSFQAEVNGIGFDTDQSMSSGYTFKLYGTQGWGISVPSYNYASSVPNWKHYRIPVGEYFTGSMVYMVFVNDHDVTNPTGESYFSNIKVFEDTSTNITLPVTLDFTQYTISPYSGAGESPNLTMTVEDGGSTLHMVGNGWQKVSMPFLVTEDTVLEFDYKSTTQAEIQGIGFDSDNTRETAKTFALYGTDKWGYSMYRYEAYASGWKHFRIPVGKYYTGQMRYVFFANDHDVSNPTGESYFRDVKIYNGQFPLPVFIDFNEFVVSPYYGGERNVSVAVEDNGNTLHLSGNGWRQISTPIQITPTTVLEFEFKSSNQGQIHGIGFDTDQYLSSIWTFQLYGSQTYGIQGFRNYASAAPDWKKYKIPVGQYYQGQMLHLFFGNDHDVTVPTGESYFRNVIIHDSANDLPPLNININNVSHSITPFLETGKYPNLNISVQDDGNTLYMNGSGWQKIPVTFPVTKDTVLEFDFRSSAPGQIQGIGFGEDAVATSSKLFQLFGTTRWGLDAFRYDLYASSGWKHFEIHVGKYYSGTMNFIMFANTSSSGSPTADSYFKNITIHEKPADPPLNIEVNFNDYAVSPYYSPVEGGNFSADVQDEGRTLHLAGNGWKQISLPVTLTPTSVLEFDFQSTAMGEIQGIGFDTDQASDGGSVFQLYGAQSYGIADFSDYSAKAPGRTHYKIPVGKYYQGEKLYLFFANDHDSIGESEPPAESYFSNIILYDFDPGKDVYDGSTLNWGEIKKQIKDIAADSGYQISSVSCTQGDCGDPINTRTGVFSFASPDVSIPTSAGDLVFQRAYSSETAAAYADVLGYGWTHNHDARLIFPADPGGMEGYVIFKDVLGNQYLFSMQADGSFQPGPGILASLVKTTSSPVIYTLTTPEQATFTFNETGRVMARANPQGHRFEYEYDLQGRLTQISADQGTRYLDLGYDGVGRIITVSDYSGRQITYTYDANGDLVSSTDLLGNVWQYAYDSEHHMTQVIDPSGKETVTTEYDGKGRAFRQLDGNGNLLVRIEYNSDGSTTVYNADGNAQTHEPNRHNVVTEKRDELGLPTNTVYDPNFRPTTITNAAGHTLGMEWSADGKNLLAKTDPAGNRTEYTYDALNNLLTETDPLENVTTYTYAGKLLTSKTDAGGNTTSYTYTPEGYLETETDPNGRTTAYTYNAHGQRTSITDSYGKITSYAYDALGRLTDTTDPRGRVTHNEYNAAGQLVRTVTNYDPNRPQNDENQYNIVTTYAYNVRGNQVSITDTYGHVTHNEYDDADHLVRTVDAAGHATTYTYDSQGHLLTTTDALGRTTSYMYDATGRRLTTIDALSQSSGTTTFDVAANTSTASDSLGRSATYHYNTLNQVVKVVDPLGNFTTTAYNANGNVESRTDALGRITHYEYDALNRLVKTTDPLGAVTETIYNTKGQRIASIDSLGHRTEYTYDEQGRLIDTLDVLGNHATNEYDDDGNLIATTDVLGHTTQYEYDAWGRKTAMVDAANRRTTYTYDALDRVVSTTDPTGTATTTYDALGQVTARTDVYGRTSSTIYDELGRAITTTDFAGNTTTNEYDEVGNLVSTTDALNHTTTYEYDALNRKVKTIDALGHTTQVAYDVLDNVTDTTDANGVVTHTIYDELNRPVVVIQNYRPPLQPDAETNVRLEYTYNAVGNRTQVKDANGHVTEFHYDALNRVTEKIDPLGNTWQYTYDLAGRLTVQVDGNNKTTNYSYDAAGHLTGIDYPAPEADVTITYNAAGQQTEMTDGQGTTSWTYDDLGRLTSVTHPDGGKVEYTYDLFGRRQTTTSHIDAADLTGKTVTYAYDEDSRLTTVTDWQAQATQYCYDALGRVQTIERPNGVTSRYTYDAAGRLTDLAHSQGSETLAAYHYTYDAAGNRLSASEQALNVPVTAPTQFAVVEQGFTAISLGWPDSSIAETGYRLERSADNQVSWQVIADLPANTLRFVDEGIAPDTQYGYRLTPYDPQGDGPAETLAAETQPVVTISYTYDALQRLTAASYNDGTIFDYTYDATGNTLQLEKTVAGQTETIVYTYDAANQLATAQAGSGTAWQYRYDGNGSLVEMIPGAQAASGAKRYTYNTAGQLTQVETHDEAAYQPQAEMIYDGQGQRLAMTAHQGSLSLTSRYLLDGQTTLAATASGQTTYYLRGVGEFQADWRYYLPDGMGNVRQVTDAQGQVAGTRSYTPWGEILEQSGQTDLTAGYLGGMLDAATGLIYIGNGQYYDPATGRFLTRDANPSQTNPYVPWRSDPTGAMLAPLALLAMVYGKKKNRGKWDNLVIIVVLGLTFGMGLSACNNSPVTYPINTGTPQPIGTGTQPPTQVATVTVTPTPTGTTVVIVIPTATGTPTPTMTITCFVTGTPTPTPTPIDIETIAYPGEPAFNYDYGNGDSAWKKTLRRYKALIAWMKEHANDDLDLSTDPDGYGARIKDEVLLSIIVTVEFRSYSDQGIFSDLLAALTNQYQSDVFCAGNCDSVRKQLIWLSTKQGIRTASDEWITKWYPMDRSYGIDIKSGKYPPSQNQWEWGNFTPNSDFASNPSLYPSVNYLFRNDGKYAGIVVFTSAQDSYCGGCLGW